MEFPSLCCVASHTGIHETENKWTWSTHQNSDRLFVKYHQLHAYMSFFFLRIQSRVFQPLLKTDSSSYNKANCSKDEGPHWHDKDGYLSVVFNSPNSVFSLSLISSFKQTSSVRFFSPSVNSAVFASSPWMKTVHIISNPLVCLSLKSGWALWVKSGCFFGLEKKIKEFLFFSFFYMKEYHCSHKQHQFAEGRRMPEPETKSVIMKSIHMNLLIKQNHLWCINGLNIDLVLLTHSVSIQLQPLKITLSCFHNFYWHSCTTTEL